MGGARWQSSSLLPADSEFGVQLNLFVLLTISLHSEEE